MSKSFGKVIIKLQFQSFESKYINKVQNNLKHNLFVTLMGAKKKKNYYHSG